MLGDFAKRLKEIRTSMNLTMSEFSDLGDVGATTQGAYEKENDDERRYPDVRYLLNLKSHGVDIHYLLTGEKSPDNVISPQTLEIINAYENADENHKAIFEATAKACAVKPKGRVDKKKDDEDPPKGGIKSKMKNIVAGGNVQAGNISNNNFSSNTEQSPRKELYKKIGSLFIVTIMVLILPSAINFESLKSFDVAEISLLLVILTPIFIFFYKLYVFPIHYEIDLWYYKKTRLNSEV